MSTPFSINDNRKEDIRQEDLLDLVERLEHLRRILLIAVTQNFDSLGKILAETKELIEEYKRRKWEQREKEITQVQ